MEKFLNKVTRPSRITIFRIFKAMWRQKSKIPNCSDQKRLDGKLALVTGGNNGIGFVKILKNICIVCLILLVVSCSNLRMQDKKPVNPAPPFSGTIFLDPDIITDSDRTTFVGLSYIGQDSRRMFDRRVNGWIAVTPFLFNSTYDDNLSIEIQVNPEFQNPDAAEIEAAKFAAIIGRLPTSLRKDVETVWIHKGIKPFGGGNNNLLIHTGQATLYENDGILEETFVHEASHTSLDAEHSNSLGWISAQESDGHFISNYARDNPTREDIAESFLLYMAIRYRSDRITKSLEKTILKTIPKRIDYFDDQNLKMHPIE